MSTKYNDHHWDLKIVAILTGGRYSEVIYDIKLKMGTQTGGRYGQVVTIRKWSLARSRLTCECSYLSRKHIKMIKKVFNHFTELT